MVTTLAILAAGLGGSAEATTQADGLVWGPCVKAIEQQSLPQPRSRTVLPSAVVPQAVTPGLLSRTVLPQVALAESLPRAVLPQVALAGSLPRAVLTRVEPGILKGEPQRAEQRVSPFDGFM